jgi:hypothetical protein
MEICEGTVGFILESRHCNELCKVLEVIDARQIGVFLYVKYIEVPYKQIILREVNFVAATAIEVAKWRYGQRDFSFYDRSVW